MLRAKHLAMLLALGCSSAAFAANNGSSIAINFGADEPSGAIEAEVLGAAGVAGTKNWNNLQLNNGFPGDDEIILDVGGVPQASSVTVEWTSNNTWSNDGRGEDTNNAPDGNDRALMLGYLDTTDTSVTQVVVDNIPAGLATGGYDVFLYVQNGVLNRGGTYTVTGNGASQEQSNVTSTIFDGTYIPGENGNYLLFPGLKGSTLTIEGMATDAALFRGPINGIEICALNACTALPNAVAGRDVIGNQTLGGTRENQVLGPAGDAGPGLSQEWYSVGNPGSRAGVEDVFNNNDPVVPAFRSASGTWWSGSDAPVSGDMLNYPEEVSPPLNDNYTVRLNGEIKIDESGTYRFADGVDDYTYLAIDTDKSGVAGDDPSEVLIDDNSWTDALRTQNGGGGGWAEIDINVSAGGEWLPIEFNMAEGGGGDSGILYWDYNPDATAGNRVGGGVGFPDDAAMPVDAGDAEALLVPDSHLRSATRELLSADIVGAIPDSPTGWSFEVNPTTGKSDAFVMNNPDSNVFTTKLDVDGAKFFINPTGNVADGASFQIIVADQILGTPAIFPPGWFFNSATGFVTFGAGGLSGDFNNDGQLDASDIDSLSAQVRASSNNAAFDLNGDKLVNGADRDRWVNELKRTYYGDSNLDGQFNSGDFVTVFTAGQYEDAVAGNSTWATGDWNGDGDFNSSDFVTAFSAGGYEIGPRAAVSAVPEPSSIVLLLIGMSALVRRRR